MSFDSHTIKTGIVSSELKRAKKTDTEACLVDKLVACVNKHLRLHLKAMFANAESTVEGLHDSHGFSAQQCTEANRLLLLTRSNIVKRFMFQLNLRMKPVALSGIDCKQVDENEFVSHEEVDAMLAITAIHSNAMAVFGECVQQLETRLEYLEISSNDSFDKEAVSPKQLCSAFYEVLVKTGMKATHISVLMRLYDLTFNRRLSSLYSELNTILIAADVLPEIILNNHSEEGEVNGGMLKRIANYYDAQETKVDPYIKRTDGDINFFAANYMSGDMTVMSDAIDLPESFKTAPSYDEINGKGCYSRKDVVVALSRLQQAFISNDGNNSNSKTGSDLEDIAVIKSSLLNSMNVKFNTQGDVVNKHVNLLDERSIDFVGMLFGVIAEDGVIHPLIKAQLLRLQISVIKVSITDKTLFENAHHPVRNVLNLITDVGLGIKDEKDRFYLHLCSIISRLLKDYYMDISSFRRAEKELIALNSRKQGLVLKKEREEQRKVIKEHARNVVLTELKCLSAKKTIPKSVQPLVLKYLPTLMINQYVQHGRDSEQWAGSTVLLKKLIQCLQPLKKNDDWAYLNDNSSNLIMELSAALCKTGQDVLTIQGLLADLKTLFQDMIFDFGFNDIPDKAHVQKLSEIVNEMEIIDVKALNATAPASVMNEDGILPLTDEEQEIEDALLSAQSKINGLPETVHPGVWFEIYNGEEHVVRRLKLSVILNDTAKIVFCDRQGKTVMEKDAGVFTEELASEKSRVIADHSTFDNALGSVIAALVA